MRHFQLLLVLIINFTSYAEPFDITNPPEDSRLNFTELVVKYGQIYEEHVVTTEDGYLLKLFHIRGKKNRPIFLMHGLLDSADVFVIRGRRSLAIHLAEQGYDVWTGNARGNKHSRRHINLNPNKQFWSFSQHEIGYYDLPAMIDFVLQATGESRVSCVGHSQGNMVFYILGATRPEYNEKIQVLIALAPVAFLHNVKPPVSTIVEASPVINAFYRAIHMEEVMGDRSVAAFTIKSICSKENSYEICAKRFLFLLAGSDPDELEPEFARVIFGHFPAGNSRKNLVHLSQISLNKRFAQFNYGSRRNWKVYKSPIPPNYDLNKVTMKVVLFSGRNDKLSVLEDVEVLRKKLPNVEYHEMKNKNFNHLDFIWGRNMDKYLFPLILNVLNNYY